MDTTTHPRWPASPALLTDTSRCPACFTALATTVCGACGLDLAVPLATDVLTTSREIAALAERRAAKIATMRAAQAARGPASAPVSPRAPMPAPMPVPMPAPSAPPPPPRRSTEEAGAPRRSGVQVLLLVAGVTALSVATVFFLFVAYLFATLTVRASITAVLAGVVLGVAAVLRRRGLSATAEGVAVVGLVLLGLDLLFIRANALLGTGAVEAWWFAGIAAGTVAGIAAVLHRLTGIRALSVAAAGLAPLATAFAVAGATGGAPAATRFWAASLSSAVVGSSVGLLRRGGAESVLARVLAATGVLGATVSASQALPSSPGTRAGAVAAVAAVCGLHLVLARRGERRADAVAAAAGLAAIGQFAWLTGLALAPGAPFDVAAVTGPALVAPAVLFALRRRTGALGLAALVAAAAVAAIPALALAGRVLLLPAAPAAAALVHPFASTDFNTFAPVAAAGTVAGLLGTVAVLLALALVERRSWAVGLAATVAAAAVLALGLVPGSAWPALGADLAVGLVAAFAGARDRRWVRMLAAAVLGTVVVLLAPLAELSPATWLPATGVALGLLVLARVLTAERALAPVLTGLLAVRVLIAAIELPAAAAAAGLPLPGDPPAAAIVLVVAATMLLSSALARRGRWARTETTVLDAVAAFAAVLAAVSATGLPWPGADALAAVSALLVAAAGVLHLTDPRASTAESLIGGFTPVLLPVAVASGLAAWAPDAPGIAAAVAVPLAVLAGVVLSAVPLRRIRPEGRAMWDSVTTAAGVVVALLVVTAEPDAAWVGLLVLALAAVVLAGADGDPFRSVSPRRHAMWAAAALVVASVWQALADRDVSQVEPYTLPAAAVLAALAGLIAWRAPASPGTVRSVLASGALIVALVPTAWVGVQDGGPRLTVAAGIAAALVLAAPTTPVEIRGVRLRPPVALVAAGVVVVTALDGVLRDHGVAAEIWWVGAAIVLAAAALVARRRGAAAVAAEDGVGAILVAALAALFASSDADAVPVRTVVAAALLAGLAVLLVQRRTDRTADGRVLLVAALTGATLAALAGLVAARPLSGRATALDPLELATAPLAVALVAIGVVRMRRDASRGSWPQLGPGLALLLVPSLLLDTQPVHLWRAVALGVVALAVTVAGAVRSESAPLLAGVAVFVVHALAQLWPWVSAAYQAVPWWLWLAVAGLLLIVLAATYERRVRDLRWAARRIAALR